MFRPRSPPISFVAEHRTQKARERENGSAEDSSQHSNGDLVEAGPPNPLLRRLCQ